MVVLIESYNAVANVAPALEFSIRFALGLPTPCDSPIMFRLSPPRVGGQRKEGLHGTTRSTNLHHVTRFSLGASGSFTFYWMFFSCRAQAQADFGPRGRNRSIIYWKRAKT